MRRTRNVPHVIATIFALVMLSACGGGSDKASDDTTPPTTGAETSTGPDDTATEPTETTSEPTGTAPTPTHGDPGKPSDSTPDRARKAQIPAAELPGLNEEWTWTSAGSGPGPGQDAPSVCLQSSLTAIGAVTEYRSDYGSSLDDLASAVQLTAVFPDEETAVTASQVLEKWQLMCTEYATDTLGLKHVKVNQASSVSTTVGDGRQWLTTYRPVAADPNASWFHAQGFVRDGDTLTYLIYTSAGQDYNYEPGHEPISLALKVAADYLDETR